MRRIASAAAVALLLAACSGGAADDPDATTTTSTTVEDGGTTTTEGEGASAGGELDEIRDLLAPADAGHRFTFTVGRQVIRGEVESVERYRVVTKLDSIQFETLVLDGDAFTRTGGEDSLSTAQYRLQPIEVVGFHNQVDQLLDAIDQGAVRDEFVRVALKQVVAQLAAIEPVRTIEAVLVDGTRVDELDGGVLRLRGRLDLAELAGDDLADLGEELLLEVELDPDGLPLRLRFPSDGPGEPGIDIAVIDYGEAPELVEPGPDQIDRTPNVDEEALLAFTDTTLVAPTDPALSIVAAVVLTPEETVEDCNQIYVGYETADGDFLDSFLLPADCATQFDDTPFDLTIGGHPAREVHILEIQVGDTVVQFDTSLPPDRIEAVAASLAPIAAADLIARVVPG